MSDGNAMAIVQSSGPGDITTSRCCELLLHIQADADRRKLARDGVLDAYHYDVGQFVEYVLAGEYSIVDGLEGWITEAKRACRARTVNRKLSAIRTRILGSKRSEGLLDILGDDLPNDIRARLERTLRRIDGVKIASNAPRQSRIASYRDDIPILLAQIRKPAIGLIIEFMVHTGCRVSEALGIELRRCDIEGNRVRIVLVGKGSKERQTWIPRDLFDRIAEHCGSEYYLFEHDWKGGRRRYNAKSVTTRIAKETTRILGRRLTAHSFRHSYATHELVDRKIPAKVVSLLLGHQSISTTLDIYAGYQVDAEAAAVVIGDSA